MSYLHIDTEIPPPTSHHGVSGGISPRAAKRLERGRNDRRLLSLRLTQMVQNRTTIVPNPQDYFTKLPFKPGQPIMALLGPMVASGSSSKRKPRIIRGLDIRLAPTMLVMGDTKYLLERCRKSKIITKRELRGDNDLKGLANAWATESQSSGISHIAAVIKNTRWGSDVDQSTEVVETAQLSDRILNPPDQCIIQKYIKCRGVHASVYRVLYTKDRSLTAFNLVNNSMMQVPVAPGLANSDERRTSTASIASQHVTPSRLMSPTGPSSPKIGGDNHSDTCLASTTTNTENLSVFEVTGRAVADLDTTVKKVVKHLQSNLSKIHAIPGVEFQKVVLDFVKAEDTAVGQDEWCLLQIKSFLLTPASYTSSTKINEVLANHRDGQGDFYDSDDEDKIIQQVRESLSMSRPKVSYAAQQQHASVMQHCKLCYRWVRKNPSTKANDSNMRLGDMDSEVSDILPEDSTEKSFLERRGKPHREGITESSRELKTRMLELKLESDRHRTKNPGAFMAMEDDETGLSHPAQLKRPRQLEKFVAWPALDPLLAGKLSIDRSSNTYNMTYRMAYSLRYQMHLRGQLQRCRDHGILFTGHPLGSELDVIKDESMESTDVGHFETCELCYQLWVANERCLSIGEACGLLFLPMKLPTVTRLPGVRENSEELEETKKLVKVKDEKLSQEKKIRAHLAKLEASVSKDQALDENETKRGMERRRSSVLRYAHGLFEKKEDITVEKLQKQELARYSFSNTPDFGQVKQQHRMALFFKEINDLPDFILSEHVAAMTCTYTFLPNVEACDFPVNMENRRHPTQHSPSMVVDLKQIKLHYFLACEDDLRGLFSQAQVPLEFETILRTPSRVSETGTKDTTVFFRGTLFLTKFLSGQKRLKKGCLHEVSVRLVCDHTQHELDAILNPHNASVSKRENPESDDENSSLHLLPKHPPVSMVVKMAIGIICDQNNTASNLEGNLILKPGVGGVYHLPHNYFDFKTIPKEWMSTVVIQYSRTKYIRRNGDEIKEQEEISASPNKRSPRKASSVKAIPSFRVESYSLKGLVRTPSFSSYKPDAVAEANQEEVVAGEIQAAIVSRRLEMAKAMNDTAGGWWGELREIFDSSISAADMKQAAGSDEGGTSSYSRISVQRVSRRKFFETILERAHEQFKIESQENNKFRSFRRRSSTHSSIDSTENEPKEPDRQVDYVTLLPLIQGPVDFQRHQTQKPLTRSKSFMTRSKSLKEVEALDTRKIKSNGLKDMCSWSEIMDHIWMKMKRLVKEHSETPGTPQAKKLAAGYAIGPKNGNEGIVFALGVFSKESKNIAIRKRRWRMRIGQRIWKAIDLNSSGAVDLAEFRSYLRMQTQANLNSGRNKFTRSSSMRYTSTGPGTVSKSFDPKKLPKGTDLEKLTHEEIHSFMCEWLSSSRSLNAMFTKYDYDASGTIEWKELFYLLEEAFSSISNEDVSFARSKILGNCARHPMTEVFTIDRTCVDCELIAFHPSNGDVPVKILKLDAAERAKLLLQSANLVKMSSKRDVDRLKHTLQTKSSSIGLLGLDLKDTASNGSDNASVRSDDTDESIESTCREFEQSSRKSLVANLRWAALRQFNPTDELVLKRRGMRRSNSFSEPGKAKEEVSLETPKVKELAKALPNPCQGAMKAKSSSPPLTSSRSMRFPQATFLTSLTENDKEDCALHTNSLDHLESESQQKKELPNGTNKLSANLDESVSNINEEKSTSEENVKLKHKDNTKGAAKTKNTKKKESFGVRLSRPKTRKREVSVLGKEDMSVTNNTTKSTKAQDDKTLKSKIRKTKLHRKYKKHSKRNGSQKATRPPRRVSRKKFMEPIRNLTHPITMQRPPKKHSDSTIPKPSNERHPLSAVLVNQQQQHRQVLQRWGESYLLKSLAPGPEANQTSCNRTVKSTLAGKSVKQLREDVNRSTLFSRVKLSQSISKSLGTTNDRKTEIELLLRELEPSATLSVNEAHQAFQEDAELETLFMFANHGNTTKARQVLEQYSQLKRERLVSTMYQGTTMLHTAALKQNHEFCKMLIEEYHVDPNNTKDSNGLSVVEVAKRNGVVI